MSDRKQQLSLNGETVQCYLYALLSEAKRRGEMFPQASDDQSADSDAVRRVCMLVEWYAERGAPTLNDIEKLRTIRAAAAITTRRPEER